jgi:hypothetical protein
MEYNMDSVNKRVEVITESAQIIERIADCILEDHVEIMLENAALKACLRELFDDLCGASERDLVAEVKEGNEGDKIWLKAWRLLNGGAR